MDAAARDDGNARDSSGADGNALDGNAGDGSSFDGSTLDGNALDSGAPDRSARDRNAHDGSSFDGSTLDSSAPDRSTLDGNLDASVRRFARNGALIAGGAAAILLQVADPVVGSAVARHSDFAHRPLDRLNNTLTFVYAVVLGTPAEAQRVAGYVDRAHEGIPGARDASHQLWVAATLYATAVQVHTRLYGAPDAVLARDILARYAPLATSLQVPIADWPGSVDAFDDYYRHASSRLEVSDEARGVAHDLFAPVVAPLWLRAALPFAALLTASLLDPDLRRDFGLSWTAGRARRANLAWGILRVVARVSPRRLREWPSRHYLARLRSPRLA